MKAIIFDLDNTLIDWHDEFIFALNNVLKNMNYNFDEKLIAKIDNVIDNYDKNSTKLDKYDMLSRINKVCNLDLPKEFIDKLIISQKDCFYSNPKLIEIIKYLAKKYDLYVISNWFTETQIGRLENMGILKYFKKVIGADINYLKPDKRAFDIILECYDSKDCISIGDSLENDVIIPLSLGMDAYWKTNLKSDKYKIIENLEDLLEIL